MSYTAPQTQLHLCVSPEHFSPRLRLLASLSVTYLRSLLLKKLLLSFFKERRAIELQQKPRIADYWALMRSTPSLPDSRKHLMLFFCQRIDRASKKWRVGRLKRGRERRGKVVVVVVGVVVHSAVCVLPPCVQGQKENGSGQGQKGRGRRTEKRGGLKHCLYAGKFWMTLPTSKCFQ